ncbi:MAG: alanine racemase, partial [Reyranellaceae bacterium]
MRGTAGTLTIDLDAIAANWRLLAQRAKPADCAAVVKADGYGLGAAQVARRLQDEGCRWFFVAHLEEAVTLRRVVDKFPIV